MSLRENSVKFETESASDHQLLTIRSSVECGEILGQASQNKNYTRTNPSIFGPRADWMKQVIAEKLSETVTPPSFQIIRFKEATVHGPGPITLPEGILIKETLQNCENDTIIGNIIIDRESNKYYLINRTEITSLSGNFIHLLVQWDGNYGHWLVECLPRLILLAKQFPTDGFKVVVSGNGGPIDKVYIDSLAYLGFDENRVFFTRFHTIKFEEIIYPTPLTIQPWVKSPFVVSSLEELGRTIVGDQTQIQSERIFIERPETSRRRLINQEEVKLELVKHGFSVVNPSKMSFSEQVIAFSNAKIVAGVLGAECTNLVFGHQGLILIGFSPEHMQDDFFWDLISHKKGKYVSLHSTANDASEGMNSSFEVNIPDLIRLVEDIGMHAI